MSHKSWNDVFQIVSGLDPVGRISHATLKLYLKVNQKGALNTDKGNPGLQSKVITGP